jgi:hypothetical protein
LIFERFSIADSFKPTHIVVFDNVPLNNIQVFYRVHQSIESF